MLMVLIIFTIETMTTSLIKTTKYEYATYIKPTSIKSPSLLEVRNIVSFYFFNSIINCA